MSTEPAAEPLDACEEQIWRALVRLLVLLPRAIDDDLSRRTGISLTRYVVLMRLSETPGRALKMSELAEAAAMSPSRMTRIVASMVSEGLVTREVVPGDARAGLATLTDAGLERLRTAWPEHLAGVRALVLDHIPPDDLAAFTRVTELLLAAVEDTDAGRRTPDCPSEDSLSRAGRRAGRAG
jgi:DNA-binding MarR family transcriptional regulator